jgi:WD40 repeat protein
LKNNSVGIIEIEKSIETQIFEGHTDVVSEQLSWFPDSDCLFFSASEDCTVKLWDIRLMICLFYKFKSIKYL